MNSTSSSEAEVTKLNPTSERAVSLSVSGHAPTPTPPAASTAPAVRPPSPSTVLTVPQARSPTPTPTASLTVREAFPPAPTRPPTPSRTTALIANLQGCDVAAVEAAVVVVADAFRRGDQTAIVERLAEQANLLEALGCKLLSVAGREQAPQVIQIYTNLALRALEQARKTIATLNDMRGGPRSQTNVQVNLGNRRASELLESVGGE